MSIFEGAGVAIATPYKQDLSVDYDEFDRLIDFQIENGTDAIIVCGTTGEAATMSYEERTAVEKHAVEYINKRVPVIIGTGANNTAIAAQLSKEAEELGADAVLVVTPYYNKATQNGLYEHFKAVAAAISIPLIIYNVPGRTGVSIEPQTIARLYKDTSNVVAIKDAGGNLTTTAMTRYLTDDGFTIYSGDDDLTVPMMSVGAKGVISVLSNIAPKQVHDMCAECLQGHFEEAGKMQVKMTPLVRMLFAEVNPIPVKKALEFLGYKSTYLRLPLTQCTEETASKLKAEMQTYGLL